VNFVFRDAAGLLHDGSDILPPKLTPTNGGSIRVVYSPLSVRFQNSVAAKLHSPCRHTARWFGHVMGCHSSVPPTAPPRRFRLVLWIVHRLALPPTVSSGRLHFFRE
jgi:hypothetical protein